MPGHRKCGPHRPKRDPELSHLKLRCIGLSQSACRPHPGVAGGIIVSLESEKGEGDELESYTLTPSKAAGDMVLARGARSLQNPKGPSEEKDAICMSCYPKPKSQHSAPPFVK